MRYWLDTEFLEAGGETPLHFLSMGIVSEDNRELYIVNRDCPVAEANNWVKQNVLPKINWSVAVSRSECRNRLLEFVGNDKEPVFMGFVSAYDWVCLAGLIGRMVDLPEGWPKFCVDLKQWAMQLGNPPRPPKPNESQAHNALNDARWTRELWKSLVKASLDKGFPTI